MGGDNSQKLLPWRGIISSPGRKPPAHQEINTVTETAPTPCTNASRILAQLLNAWVIFGKHRWVSSDACRRSDVSLLLPMIDYSPINSSSFDFR